MRSSKVAVALVPIVRHRLRRVGRGDHEVEQTVVIEVLHDRAARLVEAVDADEVADITKLADIEFRLETSRQIQPEPWNRPGRDIHPASCERG